MQLLRFATSGSVDDGKSTLIGRLLYDTKTIFEDKLDSVKQASEKRGEDMNLALLTDGLKDEVDQGITIDVAYHYFATPERKFIIADTPGHVQYTRNMVTGASTANLLTTLVDARNGIVEQTKRHAFIASLLQIPHLVVCVNKMDLVDYSQDVYEEIVKDFEEFSAKLHITDVHFIPMSALNGDNVVERSENMPWYDGPTFLYLLENIHVNSDLNFVDARFPVQTVLRPQKDEWHDYRGYAGRIMSGVYRPGDEVMVLPSGFTSKIHSIDTANGSLEEAHAPMSVALRLEDELDVSRGDMIVRKNNVPEKGQDIDAKICWFDTTPLDPSRKYILMHTTKEVQCKIKEVVYKIDINTLHRMEEDKEVGVNDLARVRFRVSEDLFYDDYQRNRFTGSFILVDEHSNQTVAAGMIE